MRYESSEAMQEPGNVYRVPLEAGQSMVEGAAVIQGLLVPVEGAMVVLALDEMLLALGSTGHGQKLDRRVDVEERRVEASTDRVELTEETVTAPVDWTLDTLKASVGSDQRDGVPTVEPQYFLTITVTTGTVERFQQTFSAAVLLRVKTYR